MKSRPVVQIVDIVDCDYDALKGAVILITSRAREESENVAGSIDPVRA